MFISVLEFFILPNLEIQHLRGVAMLTLCECRAKKLRGKNTTNLSTLLINILFAVSVRPHKALPPTSSKGMLVAIIRSQQWQPETENDMVS